MTGKEEAKKVNSLYSLASNDGPGNVITQTQLKGPNYEEWAKAVRMALRAKKKKGFIDGTIMQPDEDSDEIEDWFTVNSMIVSWIFNTIETSVRSTISYRDTAKELWDDIEQRFSVGNGPLVHKLKTEIANCKQTEEGVMSYYGRIKKIWDDLNDYDRLPKCTCNGCSCDVNGRLEKMKESERVHQFLMGLDETTYGMVRSNIIAQEPLPNMNKVYSQLMQQKQVKNMARTKVEQPTQAMSFAIKSGTSVGRGSWGDKKNNGTVCTHCK